MSSAIDPQRCLAYERRFLWLYSLVLVIAFSPSKALGQISVLVFLVGLIFFVRLQPRRHVLLFTALLIFYSVAGGFYFLIMPEFSFVNHFLFFITASSFLVFLCDFRFIASARLLKNLALISAGFVLVQALFGITQGIVGGIRTGSFDLNNGDLVRGTIEPHFMPSNSASNAMYAILLSTLILFIFATTYRDISWRRISLFGIGLFAWLLASVLHTLIFFTTATLISYFLLVRIDWHNLRLKVPQQFGLITRILVVLFVLFMIAAPLLLPTNVASARVFFNRTVSFDNGFESEKVHATYNTLVLLSSDRPLQPLFGLGPGQYSSRAALMNSGTYLQNTNLPFEPYLNPMTEQYILELFQSLLAAGSFSSSLFPFYSWLSLYGEFGLIGLATVIVLILSTLQFVRSRRSLEFPQMNFAMLILVLYICLLGIQDNYWEFTQAIFPPFLLLALCLAYLRNERRSFQTTRA